METGDCTGKVRARQGGLEAKLKSAHTLTQEITSITHAKTEKIIVVLVKTFALWVKRLLNVTQ